MSDTAPVTPRQAAGEAADKATAPPAPDPAAVAALLSAAMPGTPPELARRLFLEVADSTGLSGAPEDEADDAAKVTAALQALAAARPRDALEAMLAAQMAGCHAAAMRSLRRAARCADYPEIEALYARQAARLMALFARQAETLRGWRDGADETADAACARREDGADAAAGTGKAAQEADPARPSAAGDSTPTQPSPIKGEGLSWRETARSPAPDEYAERLDTAPSPLMGEDRGGGENRRLQRGTRNGHRHDGHARNGAAPAH